MIFIIPIILAANFVYFDNASCAWSVEVPVKFNTVTVMQTVHKKLYGYYDSGNIYLCPQLTKEERSLTYFHEYGHYVWEQLTYVQQQYWISIQWDEFITNYASTHYQEDFAETFQFVILGKKYAWDSKVIRKKIRFMQLVIQSMK
jgi:hypothetical protein